MRRTIPALIISTVLALPAVPCSVFNYSRPDGTCVGRNLDWLSTSVGWVRIMAPTDGGHGAVLFGADDHIWPQGGINDQGLTLGMTATPFLAITGNPDGLQMELDFWELLFAECATVEDVLEFLGRYDLGSMPGYFEQGQMLWTDPTGDSAIVEGDVVYRKAGDFQIITNYLQSHPYLGGWPCPRFELIEDMLMADEEMTDEYLVSIVEAAHGTLWGGFTVWSLFYDLEAGTAELFYKGDFESSIVLDVTAEVASGVAGYQMETLFNPTCFGDRAGNLAANALVLTDCTTVAAAVDCPGDEDLYAFAAPVDGTYSIGTTGPTDTVLELLDAGMQLIDWDDDSGDQGNAYLQAELTAGESCFVRVAASDHDVKGTYSLAVSGCQGNPSRTWSYLVPAVAAVPGEAGTSWASDLVVLNGGEDPAAVTVELWLRSLPNLDPARVTATLAPGQLWRQEDVVASLFGLDEAAGALHLTADAPLVVGSRTANHTGQGAYGQFIPGMAEADAMAAGETAYLVGLSEDPETRTNLGLLNPTAAPIEVEAELFAPGGDPIGSQSYEVPARSTIQVHRVIESLDAAPANDAWMRLTTSTGAFVAYASVIDSVTGDPVYRPALRVPGGPWTGVLPGVARTDGVGGTRWLTDSWLINTGGVEETVLIRLWERGEDNAAPAERSVQLEAHTAAAIEDLVQQLFGLDAFVGALKVQAGSDVLVDGRTYNQVEAGTFGQYVPLLEPSSAATPDRPGRLVMLQQSGACRSNLGLINPAPVAAQIEVRLLDAGGHQTGATWTSELAPHEVRQLDRAARLFTEDEVEAASLEIRVVGPSEAARLHAYLSVVDQLTGDPVFELMSVDPPDTRLQKGRWGRLPPPLSR